MKRILQDQTKKPIRVFETDYGYLVRSKCGWPHNSKGELYIITLWFLAIPALFFAGIYMPEGELLQRVGFWMFSASLIMAVFTVYLLYEMNKDKQEDSKTPDKSPEEKAVNIKLRFRIDAQKMQVTARFGVEQKSTAPIEPTSLFSLDGDRFRYITGDISTSKFEAQIAPRKRLTIVGYRCDTIGEMIDLARVLNHLLDEVRKGAGQAEGVAEVKTTRAAQTEVQDDPDGSFNPLD